MTSKPAPEQAVYEDPPPPYDNNENHASQHLLARDGKQISREFSASDEALPPSTLDAPHIPRSQSEGLPLPCVIPQITKPLKGAFHSPFIRAWTPELTAHNISQSDFLAFVDGLNECFVAHPVFEGASVAGQVMQMFYGISPVQWAGMGLTVASGAASAGTSYFRTRAYVKEMNQDFFHPAGLHCNILTTAKMMDKVGCEEDKLRLPSSDDRPPIQKETSYRRHEEDARSSIASSSTQQDPQLKRIEALRGYVVPLNLDVPTAVAPENLFKKMGAAQAARMARKQNKKLDKRATKAEEDYVKGARKVDKKQRKLDNRLAKLQDEFEELKIKLDRDLEKEDSARKREKLVADYDKDERKLMREVEKKMEKSEKKVDKKVEKAGKGQSKAHRKEEKVANKVRWIVISKWTDDAEEMDDDGLSSSEDTGEDDFRKDGEEK